MELTEIHALLVTLVGCIVTLLSIYVFYLERKIARVSRLHKRLHRTVCNMSEDIRNTKMTVYLLRQHITNFKDH